MSHAEPIATPYDHEREQPFGGARPVRHAHDWGADDLFATGERRGRFVRDADGGPGARQSGTGAVPLADGDAFDPRDRFAAPAPTTTTAGRRRRAPVADWLQEEEHPQHPQPEPEHWLDGVDLEGEGHEREPVSASAPTLELELPLGEVRPARRTVVVTGHPEAVRRAERSAELRHRRPGPSLDDRISHHPERLVGYAVALGVLLILIAILTAH